MEEAQGHGQGPPSWPGERPVRWGSQTAEATLIHTGVAAHTRDGGGCATEGTWRSAQAAGW